MEETKVTCDHCEACANGCTMHETKAIACDNCEACANGCTSHEGK